MTLLKSKVCDRTHKRTSQTHTCAFLFRSAPVCQANCISHTKTCLSHPYFHLNRLHIFLIEAVLLYSTKVIMFHSRFLVFLAFTLLILSVASAAYTGKRSTTVLAKLGVNQAKIVCRRVTLYVNSIDDSRCPANVQCIWQGQAKVKLTLSKGTASSTVELIIGAQASPTAQVTLGSAVYTVTLQDVVPYPGTANTAPKKAVISIVCP